MDTAGRTQYVGAKILDIIPNTGKTTFDEWVSDETLRVTCEGGVRFDAHRLDWVKAWLDTNDRR